MKKRVPQSGLPTALGGLAEKVTGIAAIAYVAGGMYYVGYLRPFNAFWLLAHISISSFLFASTTPLVILVSLLVVTFSDIIKAQSRVRLRKEIRTVRYVLQYTAGKVFILVFLAAIVVGLIVSILKIGPMITATISISVVLLVWAVLALREALRRSRIDHPRFKVASMSALASFLALGVLGVPYFVGLGVGTMQADLDLTRLPKLSIKGTAPHAPHGPLHGLVFAESDFSASVWVKSPQ